MAEKKKYIESHSSYVKIKQHQYLNDGSSIKERDWTTIGNIERYVPNQTPIYQSGNFIITVDNSSELTNYDEFNGDVITLTLNDIKNTQSEEEKKNELNNNIYDLRTFAYYGSCTELIRSTITFIISNFPYELYCSDKQIYYESNNDIIAYNKNLNLVINPSNIDLYSVNKVNDKYYIANNLSDNYQLIDNNNNVFKIPKTIELQYNGEPKKCYNIGEYIGQINILSLTLYLYQGNDNNIVYLHNSEGWSIRPKQIFFDNFYNSLDKFGQVLLNTSSLPKYTATFNVITPVEYGIKTVQETFTLPKGDGNWNIGGDEEQFQSYMSRLFKIAEYYDEYYSDNMWRMMTHEAIKNFDWSFTKEINDELTNKYTEGGEKISKVIRLYGREFDEVKRYIDNINFTKNLNYQDTNTATNDLLPSLLENDGWYLKSWENEESYLFFLKMLRLNSRQILKHKGTKVGIEMLLSLFGLKSKNMSQENYHYNITEYEYQITQTISHENAEKIAILNSEKDDYDIFDDDKYQGLTVIEYNNELYPFYDKNKTYDNGIYYQMKGGWLNTSYKPIKVNTYEDLLVIPYNMLFNNMLARIIGKNQYFQYNQDNDTFEEVKNPFFNFNESLNDIKTLEKPDNTQDLIDNAIYHEIIDEVKTIYRCNLSQNGYVFTDITKDPYCLMLSYESLQINTEVTSEILKENIKTLANTMVVKITDVPLMQDELKYEFRYDETLFTEENQDVKYPWVKQLKKEPISYVLYDIHNGQNNYDNGMSYLKVLLDPIKYHLDNDLFNINNKEITNFIMNEEMNDIFFERKDFQTSDLKESEKIIDYTDKNNVITNDWTAKSLKTINVKNIKIEFSDVLTFTKETKETLIFYLQQMIPSLSICEVIF